MSFNRGIKRDSFGNRNFGNRNMGGGGGGVRGNMGGGGGGVHPWEGGMMPGRGILPTPNNNLSLASPQAQLAIASNLLSNLLRTQQDNQPQKVPSLLSLGNNFSGPGPNFHNQQNYSQNMRFADRPGRQNIKNRVQPYNKMGNRARDGVAGRRGPQQSRTQSGNQRQNGTQRNDKSKANAASKNQAAKKEQQDKTSDKTAEKAEAPVATSQEDDDSENKKRDWKDEKKESEKTEGTDGDKDGDKAFGKKSAARHAESRYAEVPMNSMFCHVCNKHMWDGFSFDNHLRGRAHQLMMDKLDEAYKLKVELMRHELRVTEEQRELSLNNSKRRGKKLSVDLNVREYCTMCDLNFYGTLSNHRKSEKHQQLKTFLHPRCFPCAKEFPSRIEYDEHCLTPTHMKNALHNEEQRKNKKKDKLNKGESEIRTAEDEEKDVGTEQKGDKAEEAGEDVEYLLDIDELPLDPKLKIPSYKYCRQKQVALGKSLVKEVQGYHCEKCRRFMFQEEDMNAHLRSITHYRNFVQEAKNIISAAEEAAKAEKEAAEAEAKKAAEGEQAEETDEPEAKRAKLDNDAEENNASETQEASEENEELKNDEGDDKYDPLEANAESDEEHQEDVDNTVPCEEEELAGEDQEMNDVEDGKEEKEGAEEEQEEEIQEEGAQDQETQETEEVPELDAPPPPKITTPQKSQSLPQRIQQTPGQKTGTQPAKTGQTPAPKALQTPAKTMAKPTSTATPQTPATDRKSPSPGANNQSPNQFGNRNSFGQRGRGNRARRSRR